MGTPLIVFGAFDRHNLGDLLFGRLAQRLLGEGVQEESLHFAGLIARDLTACGGQQVEALAMLAERWQGRPVTLLHAGGEILGCSLAEAAVMLLEVRQARALLAGRPGAEDLRRWAQARLAMNHEVAYLAPRPLFAPGSRFLHHGIGGATLATLPTAMQVEAMAALRGADGLCVRERVTRAWLRARGVRPQLAPDLVVLTPQLFAGEIANHAASGEPERARRRFPPGYVAVQFAAAWGDDQTLNRLAAQLEALRRATGLGLVLFAAGQAPWHDDLEVYRRLADRLRSPPLLCQTAHIFDLCALLAGCALFCGSSLHARILAQACGRPAVSLARAGEAAKITAHLASWPDGRGNWLSDGTGLAQVGLKALHAGGPSARRIARWQSLALAAFRRQVLPWERQD